MTDSDNTAPGHTMNDNNPTPPESNAGHDVFKKETIRRIGDPDDHVLDRATSTTDPGTMNQQNDVVIHPCKCGNTVQDFTVISQCSLCRQKCCPECRVTLSRQIRCPDCAEQEFHLTKAVFIALYLLDNTTDDLFHQQIEDTAATTLLEHNYVQVEAAGQDGQIRVNPDDPLSVSGKEALHVGEQLYSDDEDVNRLMDELTIQQVANNGR